MPNLLATVILFLAIAARPTAGDGIPPFKILTKRDNDRVEVKFEKDKVIFSIYSPFGISHAACEGPGLADTGGRLVYAACAGA
jgi:hypothetical protein